MFIYIVINEKDYPIGTFVKIDDARKYKELNNNSKIIKSNLVGSVKSLEKNSKNNLPDDIKKMFGTLL